ncbi:MAG TPA: histidine phosphatase family protein, partial [Jatrophihabitantaceae bacterium]|nr:histidine phosphatase family protein [Jatrophihabitantaceae bacterium]
MSTVLLVRHGLTALTGPVLAGRTPGVHLDERGARQAAALAERVAAVPLAAIVSSPLERCTETAQRVLDAQRAAGRSPQWHIDDRLTECGYGAWTGRPLKELAKDPLWKIVQARPSAATFPDGESLADTSARAIAAVRDWDARLGADSV